MGSFKPDVKNSRLPSSEIDTAKITVSLYTALLQNGIDSFQNFRIVKLYKGFYYQVWQSGFDSLTYINCESGNVLINGDKHYAAYLAQRYMWEQTGKGQSHEHDHRQQTASLSGGANIPVEALAPVKPNSKIVSNNLVTSFAKHYKASNKILPVYEVAFDREDGIQLYIDTRADRLVFASDHMKRWFASFFSLTHSWSFLNGLGKTKSFLLGSFSALCFFSSVFGFFVYNVVKQKKKGVSANKRWHRVLGNVFLLTTLLYAFSGAWHAFAKLPQKPRLSVTKASIASNEIATDVRKVFSSYYSGEKLTNLSVTKMNGEVYWQLSYKKEKDIEKKYVNTKTGIVLQNGDAQYSAFLAAAFKNAKREDITSTTTVASFNHRYIMMNKRLPVMENRFANGEAVLVETATGEIAAVTKPADEAERFSFSNLHMHHYWEMWLGKETGKTMKTTVLIASTLGLLLLALSGTMIYLKKRTDNKHKAVGIS